ncbi:MAG: hypothetical protein ACLP4V_06950 [Methylocella sp.]
MANPFLQDAVGGQTDHIFDPLGFEVFVDSGIGEARVSAEIEARDFAALPRHNRLQHAIPTVSCRV